MPTGVAKIQPQIDPGKHKIDVPPAVRAECDAIGRCAIDAISVEPTGQRGAPVTQWTRGGDGVAHGGLLDIGRDNAHVAESGGDFGKGGDSGTVNAVVITDEDARFHSLDETRLGAFLVECS